MPVGHAQRGARQYDPVTGRFISVDPVFNSADPQTFSGYTYAGGNPAVSSDPSGLCPQFPDCNNVPEPGPKHHRKPGVSLYPCGTPGGVPCNASPVVYTSFGSGIELHAHAASWTRYTNALLTAEAGFYAKYGYLPDFTACTAGLNGGISPCGGKGLMDVYWFLDNYLCTQPGITCTGPAAGKGVLASTMIGGGGLILGFGRDGGAAAAGGGDGGGTGDGAPEAAGGGRALWGSWSDYPKVTVGGREYADINGTLYTQHAVERMAPSGLGNAAGGVSGRSISPNFVQDVLENPDTVTPVKGPNGEPRLSYVSGSVQVITENGIVVTIITR